MGYGVFTSDKSGMSIGKLNYFLLLELMVRDILEPRNGGPLNYVKFCCKRPKSVPGSPMLYLK